MWISKPKPEIAGKKRKSQKSKKKTTYRKPKAYRIPNYKLSRGLVFTFSFPGDDLLPPLPFVPPLNAMPTDNFCDSITKLKTFETFSSFHFFL